MVLQNSTACRKVERSRQFSFVNLVYFTTPWNQVERGENVELRSKESSKPEARRGWPEIDPDSLNRLSSTYSWAEASSHLSCAWALLASGQPHGKKAAGVLLKGGRWAHLPWAWALLALGQPCDLQALHKLTMQAPKQHRPPMPCKVIIWGARAGHGSPKQQAASRASALNTALHKQHALLILRTAPVQSGLHYR
eukprot:scaffold17352_cov17-Tisochrysis_lutea.AAC.1